MLKREDDEHPLTLPLIVPAAIVYKNRKEIVHR